MAALKRYFVDSICYHRRLSGTANAPVVHFTHATGFHGYTYRPLLERVPPHVDVYAPDLRGHGGSQHGADVESFESWQVYVDDVVAWLDAAARPVVLAGHSVGATVSLLVAAARPEAVAGLLLVEPVVAPWYLRGVVAVVEALGQMHRIPLAAGAARRKNDFATADEALARYEGRGAFTTWQRSFLESYVEKGFVQKPDGGVRLACAPAWESRAFALTPRNPVRDIGVIACPVTLLVGDVGSTCGAASTKEIARKLPQTRVRLVSGASHFLPMEQPELVLEELALLLEERETFAG